MRLRPGAIGGEHNGGGAVGFYRAAETPGLSSESLIAFTSSLRR